MTIAKRSGILSVVAKNPHAVALGRKGGKKGGKARAANLTPEQLSEIGQKGAAVRWERQKQAKGLIAGQTTTPRPDSATRRKP